MYSPLTSVSYIWKAKWTREAMHPSCCPCICKPFSTLVKSHVTASASRVPDITWENSCAQEPQEPQGPPLSSSTDSVYKPNKLSKRRGKDKGVVMTDSDRVPPLCSEYPISSYCEDRGAFRSWGLTGTSRSQGRPLIVMPARGQSLCSGLPFTRCFCHSELGHALPTTD